MFEAMSNITRPSSLYTVPMGRRDKLDADTLAAAGKRLREVRDNRDQSLEEVARAVGVTPQALSSAEIGKTQSRSDILLKLCAYYDLDPYRILFGRGKDEIAAEVRARRRRMP